MEMEHTGKIQTLDQLPLVLQLDQGGNPQAWIDFTDSCYYMSKNLIAWSAGETEVTLRGGTNAASGKRSILMMNTIVAIKQQSKGNARRFEILNKVPLTNKTLFKRDKFLCTYCGIQYGTNDLSRDHIIPTSKGGPNNWMNCTTACSACNLRKDDLTPEEAHMPLLFCPYIPNKSEYLILSNKRILGDQLDFLLARVPKESRLLN